MGLIGSLYFYADRFALAIKQASGCNKYGFIDKEGNTRIDFVYDEARPFEDYGFARVKKEDKLYLIDTTGREYPLTEYRSQRNRRVLASTRADKKGPIRTSLAHAPQIP